MGVKKKDLGFEDSLKKLEEIASKMGEESLSLEESLKMFQEGMELSTFCNKKLDEAEKKISIVIKNSEGKLIESDFSTGEE
jgi:exodeoxyribonuclease VII small subunit